MFFWKRSTLSPRTEAPKTCNTSGSWLKRGAILYALNQGVEDVLLSLPPRMIHTRTPQLPVGLGSLLPLSKPLETTCWGYVLVHDVFNLCLSTWTLMWCWIVLKVWGTVVGRFLRHHFFSYESSYVVFGDNGSKPKLANWTKIHSGNMFAA